MEFKADDHQLILLAFLQDLAKCSFRGYKGSA